MRMLKEEILEIREKLEQKKQDLVRMVDEDAEAFEPTGKGLQNAKRDRGRNRQRRKKLWRPHLKMRQKHHCVS